MSAAAAFYGAWQVCNFLTLHPLSPTFAIAHPPLAYNYPWPFSANIGFEQGRTGLLYFVVDSAQKLSLVLTLDKPTAGDGGTMLMQADSPDIASGRGATPVRGQEGG